MTDQWWSWALTAVGVLCFWLAGRKVWWCWYIGIAGQVTWTAYSLLTEQWGFLVGVVVYTLVYTRNAIVWTREHRREVTDGRVLPRARRLPGARVPDRGAGDGHVRRR